MKILIVDDYATMRRIMRNLLSQLNLTDVNEASNVETALIELKKNKYGLVLCNDSLPPQSGLDLLKAIRNDSELSNLPFVMVLDESNTSTESIIAARKAGVSNVIRKPFNAETLKGKLTSVLGL
ncbi:MAG: response regulator [Flectobacillus sp.]|uniref:response regulator n=1 Tax=Flectobacillus sp. TaxID=50419 RepID=UPI003B9B46E7